jgi:hypothetical protein
VQTCRNSRDAASFAVDVVAGSRVPPAARSSTTGEQAVKDLREAMRMRTPARAPQIALEGRLPSFGALRSTGHRWVRWQHAAHH